MAPTIKKDLTVGIYTCYCKDQILETVRTLISSTGVDDFDLIIVADRFPVDQSLKNELTNLGAHLIENEQDSSAYSKIRQIITLTRTPYLLLTQDDVLFDNKVLKNTVNYFNKHPKTTFIGVRNIPLPPENIIEAGLNIGTRLNNHIGRMWNQGDNYLAMLGRVMAFRTDWLKNMDIDPDSVSLDAYMYFENKRLGGKYKCLWDSWMYFRNPQNLAEHLRKSSRFQHSLLEMKTYPKFTNLENHYRIPLWIIIYSSFLEFIGQPFDFIVYLLIFSYTRLFKTQADQSLTALWEVDLSTKKIK